MKVITWNVRGIGIREKCGAIRRFIKKNKTDLLMLQETKKEELSPSIIRELWGLQEVDWFSKPSVGVSGGLLTIWNPAIFKVTTRRLEYKSISVKGLLIEDASEVCFTSAYGPNVEGEREDFWNELDLINSWRSSAWCSRGDFNTVRFPSERKGGHSFSRSIEEFSDFIVRNELSDLPLIGGRFTWSNGQVRCAMSRLDRFLTSSKWDMLFPNTSQVKCFCPISDHCLVFLDSEEID